MSHTNYKEQFGWVYDLESGKKQILEYDVPQSEGITVMYFFDCTQPIHMSAFENMEKESWMRSDRVSVIAVESSMKSKEIVQEAIGKYIESGLIDKAYYNPDSNAVAYWYYKLNLMTPSAMDSIKNEAELTAKVNSFSALILPLMYGFVENDGVKNVLYFGAGGGVANNLSGLKDNLRTNTNIPVDGENTGVNITFDPNGGSVSQTSTNTKVNGCLASLPTPTRSGYAFADWYTAPAGGSRVTLNTVFTKDTTIYAHWNKVSDDGVVYKQSGDLNTPKMSKEEIIQLVNGTAYALPSNIFDVEPSASAPYATGKVSDAVLQVAFNRLNAYRKMAGLPAASLDSTMTSDAQHGAVVMAALKTIDHSPSRPSGMSDAFYNIGRRVAGTSNLSLGIHLGIAVDAFMDDSDTSNVSALGHRRWQLNPKLGKVGFGYVISNRHYVVENIHDNSGAGCDYDFISWPASGYFPHEWFGGGVAWSVTLNPDKYTLPSKDDVAVTLTREKDGKTWSFSKNSTKDGYFNVDTRSYGVGNCIIFLPSGLLAADEELDGTYKVTVSGIKDKNGKSTSLSYKVDFFLVPQLYTITFDANGGTCDVASAVTQENGKLAELPTPTRAGYKFEGWWTAPNGMRQVTTSTTFNQPATVYALWTKKPAETFNVSVGEYSGGKVMGLTDTAKEGSKVTFFVFKDKNYELTSLTVTASDGTKVDITRNENTSYSFTMPSDDVTINVVFSQTGGNTGDDPNEETGFTDIPAGEYYTEPVKWAVENGVTTGASATTFSPNTSCTRAEMVTFLWRAAGSQKASGNNKFIDVPSNSYYYDAVKWAVENGITTGTSSYEFSPNAKVNRAQTVTFLYRLAGEPPISSSSKFNDVKSGEYYSNAVIWAVTNGITNGTNANGTEFSPLSNCTRGQIVTFLWRYMEK